MQAVRTWAHTLSLKIWRTWRRTWGIQKIKTQPSTRIGETTGSDKTPLRERTQAWTQMSLARKWTYGVKRKMQVVGAWADALS